ncbi:hypothetical protein PMAYCL1PPCAC_09245, partial [Pristionchus mayeri]
QGIVLFRGILPTKEGKVEYASDVWSFGVLLWEMYTNGAKPYGEIDSADIYKYLTERNIRLSKPEKCPEEIYSTMLECWNIEPSDRPTFTQLLEDLEWDFKTEAIVKGCPIGNGFFGEVYEGTLFGNKVALKTPYLIRMSAEDFLKEAEVARNSKHPNVLRTIGICSSQHFIILEFMKCGNLQRYEEKHEFSPMECISVAQKIACGMKYLANKKIVHRDLAARNVLIGETIETIKVSDFGLARTLVSSPYYITYKEAFPAQWTAPEGMVLFFQTEEGEESIVPEKLGRITEAADVWSFGVVLWEMHSRGQIPYSKLEMRGNIDLFKYLIEKKTHRLEQPMVVQMR